MARPIDIKLLVTGVTLSFLEATGQGGDLAILAGKQRDTVQITMKIIGRTDPITLMPELERLAGLVAPDGVGAALPLPDGDTARLLVPIGTQEHYNARNA